MAILVRGTGPRRRHGGRRTGERSVREVCLLGPGLAQTASEWPAGERVEWGGRAYRVAALQSASDDAPAYVHLKPETDSPTNPTA